MTQMLPFKSLQSNWDKSNILEIILDAVRFYVLCGIDHSRSSSELSVKLQVFEERRVSGGRCLHRSDEQMSWDHACGPSEAGPTCRWLGCKLGRIFRGSLIGDASRGDRSGVVNARVEHCPGKSSVPLTPVEGGNGHGLRLCGGLRHVEPLADALDGTGLWSHSRCE